MKTDLAHLDILECIEDAQGSLASAEVMIEELLDEFSGAPLLAVTQLHTLRLSRLAHMISHARANLFCPPWLSDAAIAERAEYDRQADMADANSY
jgi:hypothetical protein